MSKIGIVGDLHFGIYENKESFLEYQIDTFKWIIKTFKDEGIDTVVQLGDFFDKRKYINIKILKIVLDLLKANDLKWYVLAGNHDTYYKNNNEITSIDLLLQDSNFTVISELPVDIKLHDESFLFIPWISKDSEKEYEKIIKKSKSKVAFGHLEVSGFEMMKGIVCDHDQIKRNILDYFDVVFSGHFHLKSINKNIVYTGTPLQLNWSDANTQKGIIIYDVATKEYEYKWNPSVKYVKLYINKDEDLNDEILESLRNKYVKIYLNVKSMVVEKYLNKLIDICQNFDIIDNTTIANKLSDVSLDVEKLDILTIWDEYMNSLDYDDKDKKNMTTIFKTVYKEAMSGAIEDD